jgi:hypothetical protein
LPAALKERRMLPSWIDIPPLTVMPPFFALSRSDFKVENSFPVSGSIRLSPVSYLY